MSQNNIILGGIKMSNSKNDSKHYTKTVVNYICELASHDDAGLKLTHSVRRWIIYRCIITCTIVYLVLSLPFAIILDCITFIRRNKNGNQWRDI